MKWENPDDRAARTIVVGVFAIAVLAVAFGNAFLGVVLVLLDFGFLATYLRDRD